MTNAGRPSPLRPACLLAAIASMLAACGSEAGEPDAKIAAAGTAPRPTAAPVRPGSSPAEPKAAPRSVPWSPTGYALNGAEPFWGGTLTGTRLLYMTPEDQFGDVIATTAAYGAEEEVYSGTYGGRPFVLALVRRTCSNGLSDHLFAFSATLRVKGEARRGCADAQ